jgi:hypothetical protein
MAEMALETVFRFFLYVVVVLVVIGLIVNFRDQIVQSLGLCNYLPSGCPQQECITQQPSESVIDANVLNKYCKFCWDKTGEKDYKKDCLCYVIKGEYASVDQTVLPEYCKLKCENPTATSVLVVYDSLLKTINIEC